MKKPAKGLKDNQILNNAQKIFLNAFTRSELKDVYRLSGGTALSAFYLEHRWSEDLDFFSSERVRLFKIEEFMKSLEFVDNILFTKVFDRNIFKLTLADSNILKVEFTYYPRKNIEPPFIVDSLQIDSFLDVLVNKICAIADRFDAKDYIDIYWALSYERMSLLKLIEYAEKKCEIKGIKHILKSRLLQIPEGIEGLQLRSKINRHDIEKLFQKCVKEIIRKEIRK